MQDDGPIRIKDALGPLGRRLGLRSPVEAAKVFARWEEVVGPGVAAHARPSSLKGGVLRIVTDSSIWTTEISYLTEEIKTKANQVAGARVVSEVRVWTGTAVERPAAGGPGDGTSRRGADAPEQAEHKVPPESPEEALARAKNAWWEARSRDDRGPAENRETRR